MAFSPLVLLPLITFPVSSASLLPYKNSSMQWQGWQMRDKRETTNETSERGKIETTKVISAITGNSDPDKSIFKKTLKDLKTYAVLKNDLKGSLPADFTICSTVFISKHFNHFPLILIGTDEEIFFKSFIYSTGLVNTSVVGLSIQDVEYHRDESKIPKVFPDQWLKICVGLSTVSGSIKMVVDGILVHDIISETLKNSANKVPTNLSGKITIGVGKYAEGWVSTDFNVTNLNVFSSSLSVGIMKQITEHNPEKCDQQGDYLNWEEMEWETHGDIHIQTVSREKPCMKEPDTFLFYTKFSKMSDCMHHCQKVGGRAPKVVTKEQWNELQTFMKLNYYSKGDNTLSGTWLSVSDAEEEGKWKDFYTGELMQHKGPFRGSGPSGGERQNCAFQLTEDMWIDEFCAGKTDDVFCACSHVERPYLHLRGLCSSSYLDTFYIPRTNMDDVRQLQYVGAEGTIISYDDESKQWSLNFKGTTGYSKSSKLSYILGKHNWTIENDAYECNNGKPHDTQLKLTSCRETQFTCNSGQCVEMEDRCDQLADCRDESDERDCHLLILTEGYNNKIPPLRPVAGKSQKVIAPVPVRVSITLLKIVDIEEVKHSIDIQFAIDMEWYESRTTYNNLKKNSAMNVLTSEDIGSLWLPILTYTNTDQKDTTRLGLPNEWSTHIKVRREGSLTRGGKEVVDEVEVFHGDQNPLVMAQVYTKRFQCQYDFQLYPFDTQTCTIRMDASADDLNIVKLVPNKITMKESLDLTLFEVKSWSLEYIDASNKEEGVWMKMDLQRKVMNELMTTFLPSILLMIITFATTFFKLIWFEAALSVNLTTMLMMTTISIGKMQTLPTTAYIRMIDIWLVFCQLVPFAEVILLTAQEYYRDNADEEDQDQRVIVKSEKNKVGPEILVKVANKTEVFEDNEAAAPGEANSSNRKKMQRLKTLGGLNIYRLYLNVYKLYLNAIFKYFREKDPTNDCCHFLFGIFWCGFNVLPCISFAGNVS